VTPADLAAIRARLAGPMGAPGWEDFPTAAYLVTLGAMREDLAALLDEVERLWAEADRLTPAEPPALPEPLACPRCGGRISFGLGLAVGASSAAECNLGAMRIHGHDYPTSGCGWRGRVVRRADGGIDTMEATHAR
jgi:hypothetical protein